MLVLLFYMSVFCQIDIINEDLFIKSEDAFNKQTKDNLVNKEISEATPLKSKDALNKKDDINKKDASNTKDTSKEQKEKLKENKEESKEKKDEKKDKEDSNIEAFLKLSTLLTHNVAGYCETVLSYLKTKEDELISKENVDRFFKSLKEIESKMDKGLTNDHWVVCAFKMMSDIFNNKFDDKETQQNNTNSGKDDKPSMDLEKSSLNKNINDEDIKSSQDSKESKIALEKFSKALVNFIDDNAKRQLMSEILSGNFKNVPKTMLIEDDFIDYLLLNAKLKTKDEYNNVSKFLHIVKDQKELTYDAKILKMASGDYLFTHSPTYGFILPAIKYLNSKYDTILEAFKFVSEQLENKKESQEEKATK